MKMKTNKLHMESVSIPSSLGVETVRRLGYGSVGEFSR